MSAFDKNTFLARAFEEFDRVINTNPDISYRSISLSLGKNKSFLSDVKARPDYYPFTIEYLVKLNEIYGIDDIYIMKGIRYKAIQDEYSATKGKLTALKSKYQTITGKLEEIRPLLNSL